MFDPRWRNKRRQIIERDNNRCRICGKSEGQLLVHHKQYHYIKRLQLHADPWDYDHSLMITLCESCHNRGHYRYKVPIKFI
ncbi:MAG: HNH endonuclease [Pedobacter sp.]|nr:MAG: HNH endonuclease [Pedobacter sp.]